MQHTQYNVENLNSYTDTIPVPTPTPTPTSTPIIVPEIDYSKKLKVKKLKSIKTYITYINTDNEIEIINQKKLKLNNKNNIVMRSQLIDIIKQSQQKHNVKYKLISVMVYNIHVTPDTLPDYIESPEDFISLFTLSRVDSFELRPTLALLKQYNGIYFFFFECPPDGTDNSDDRDTGIENSNKIHSTNNTTTRKIYIKHSKKKQSNDNGHNRHNKTKRYDKYTHVF
jgi:hypothetical protein